jgi:hypothetical protein
LVAQPITQEQVVVVVVPALVVQQALAVLQVKHRVQATTA